MGPQKVNPISDEIFIFFFAVRPICTTALFLSEFGGHFCYFYLFPETRFGFWASDGTTSPCDPGLQFWSRWCLFLVSCVGTASLSGLQFWNCRRLNFCSFSWSTAPLLGPGLQFWNCRRLNFCSFDWHCLPSGSGYIKQKKITPFFVQDVEQAKNVSPSFFWSRIFGKQKKNAPSFFLVRDFGATRWDTKQKKNHPFFGPGSLPSLPRIFGKQKNVAPSFFFSPGLFWWLVGALSKNMPHLHFFCPKFSVKKCLTFIFSCLGSFGGLGGTWSQKI